MSETTGRLDQTRGAVESLRLSVVIPCYNSEATITAQLSALAGQTTRYWWEVLVVDNDVRFRETVTGVFRQAWAWAESGAHVQRRYAPAAVSSSFDRMAWDFARHLGWKAVRVRTRADLAQWIWLAGWLGGLLSARRTLERPGG